MKGTISGDGTVTITFNLQAEKLEAPGGRMYLPCDECGDIQICDFNVVSILCDDCDDGQPSEYDEWQDLYGGDDWDHGMRRWRHS
jgi:hypothetical protein